mmetsp:Transcript_138423/g.442401  ORF Transcript_138423/g.442401 Transcript_138423/m.442401 type:complete len:219 (+) Transcript_138423:2320-2976(+)
MTSLNAASTSQTSDVNPKLFQLISKCLKPANDPKELTFSTKLKERSKCVNVLQSGRLLKLATQLNDSSSVSKLLSAPKAPASSRRRPLPCKFKTFKFNRTSGSVEPNILFWVMSKLVAFKHSTWGLSFDTAPIPPEVARPRMAAPPAPAESLQPPVLPEARSSSSPASPLPSARPPPPVVGAQAVFIPKEKSRACRAKWPYSGLRSSRCDCTNSDEYT